MSVIYKKKNAIFSEDGKHRFILTRTWDEDKDILGIIMLNPSKADYEIDDPTIKTLVNFVNCWGYGGIIVGNLYSYISPDSKNVLDLPINIRTKPENETYVLNELILKSKKVVYAWGNGQHEPEWLKCIISKPYVIETSNYNIPKHPLSRGRGKFRPNPTLQIYIRS